MNSKTGGGTIKFTHHFFLNSSTLLNKEPLIVHCDIAQCCATRYELTKNCGECKFNIICKVVCAFIFIPLQCEYFSRELDSAKLNLCQTGSTLSRAINRASCRKIEGIDVISRRYLATQVNQHSRGKGGKKHSFSIRRAFVTI